MPYLSKKLLFAIEAVLDIAYHGGDQPVQASALNGRHGVPKRYLEPVLQQLVRLGVLEGVRGPRGGYRLGRERRQITLAEIASAVRSTQTGLDPLTADIESDLAEAVVRPLARELTTRWEAELSTITIEDLFERARRAGLRSDIAERLDYAI